MAGVQLTGLTKKFGEAVAVDDISLQIADGELVALLGPSGCGKTTTLRMLAGFLRPTAGQIRVGERVLSTASAVVPPEQRRMSMIFQSYAIWPHMTVFENVAFGLRLRKLASAEVTERVNRVLQVVHLDQLVKRYPSELSGGQQQRVALARALVVEPETLLLDEPLSNLDANLREEMRFEIRRLHDEFGITSVYVTHDQGEAMVTSDRVVVMNQGRIEQVGTPEEVYETPRTRFVALFIGTNNVIDCRLEGCHAIVSGGELRLTEPRGGAAKGPASLAIRPHDIEIFDDAQPPQDRLNLLPGRVRRQTYLGDCRDYIVAFDDGSDVRVVTKPWIQHAPGAKVWLKLAPERCRVLAAV